MKRGAGGRKEINRTNLSKEAMAEGPQKPVGSEQLKLLKARAAYPVFDSEAKITVSAEGSQTLCLGARRTESPAGRRSGHLRLLWLLSPTRPPAKSSLKWNSK